MCSDVLYYVAPSPCCAALCHIMLWFAVQCVRCMLLCFVLRWMQACLSQEPVHDKRLHHLPTSHRCCTCSTQAAASAPAPPASPMIMGVVEALFKWKPLFNMAAGKARG